MSTHSPDLVAAALPRRQFAVAVVQSLVDAGYVALWAGGCVRDLLLGRHPEDFDVATSAAPEQVRQLFGKRRTLTVGESFGVVIVLGPPGAGQVEVATFRTEGPYADGRRPDHVVFATPEADAQRRDFTINGMFFDPLAERVLDYVGGEHDLRAGVIRAIGDPHARMTEDKLRMLRAVRFAAVLDFQLDPATAAAVQAMASQILVVSWERIAAELQKMLRHRHRNRAVRLTEQLGLLHHIIPELLPDAGADDASAWTRTLNLLAALDSDRLEPAAALLLRSLSTSPADRRRPAAAGTVGDVCRRLKLSNEQREAIEWLVHNQHALDGAELFPPSRLKRLLAHRLTGDLTAMLRAEVFATRRPSPSLQFVEDYLLRTPITELNPPPLVTGEDLVQMGVRPGPKFKAWLDAVRDAQLNGEVTSREAALERLRELAHP